ncbi:hypothetical protein F4556_004551 [Kitasatospora gansuensis]|uniref:Uncharacterized protein n=1 Tax=Kitasatospora gansuensis TaxID=258050 RepID=A0A7W7SGP0_9ACTN|nr:hypothetical protein [Kitasatospora gansuensis]MBB4949016.1 hypothetical protein [Kitasatospora gansuensis]
MSPEYRIRFELPPDFREIPVGADLAELTDDLRGRIGEDRVEDTDPVLLKQLLIGYRRTSWQLAETGAYYAASCFGLIDEGRPSAASLLISHQEVDCSDPETAVAGIIEIRRRGSDRRQLQRYELPCGPAAVEIELDEPLMVPAAVSPTGADVPIPVATLQAWIPVPAEADPTRRSLTVVTFSTPSVQDWETYCPVVVELLRTVSFDAAA